MKFNKILVTGGAGFIGSCFANMLFQKDQRILVVDKLTYAGDRSNLIQAVPFLNADINDLKPNWIPDVDCIVNFAAETHVDNSLKDETPFHHTNYMGTANLLKIARDMNVKRFVQVSCYDEETKTLTKSGLKHYNELQVGDIVFTLNNFGFVEEQPIEKIFIQEYEGEMLKLKNGLVDMMVTPNHRMYDDKLNVFEANTLETWAKYINYRLPYPQGLECGKNDSVFIGDKSIDLCDLFYISGVFIGDGFTAYQEKIHKNKSGLSKAEFSKRRNEKGQFISGVTGDNKIYVSKCYRIFIDVPENDESRNRIECTLTRLGIKWHAHKGKAGEHIYFSSKLWSNYFEQFKQYSKNRIIPDWMLEYKQEYLKCLYEGLIDTDGSAQNIGNSVRYCYTTISKELVDDICELSIKIGKYPSVYYNHNISYINNRKIEGYAYNIVFASRPKAINVKWVKRELYNNKVWCITVKNKNFLTERNGCYAFSGNTDEVFGPSKNNECFTEEDRLNPCNVYAASKASAEMLVNAYHKTYGLNTIITRGSNTFGENQFAEKLIPLTIKNALENKPIPIYGDGSAKRMYIYVKDHARAIEHCMNFGVSGEVYNIPGVAEFDAYTVAYTICYILQKPIGLITFVEDRKGHDSRYLINGVKLNLLKFRYEYPKFYDMLQVTCDYYKKKWGYNVL